MSLPEHSPHGILTITTFEGGKVMISYFRLWRLLDRRGYSKRDIIKLAGISESTFRKLINNEAVRMDVLERLCDALNVDVGDICSLRGR